MEFPERTPNHIAESDSWKVLEARTPAEWVIREVSERDYGIDCYIELITNKNRISGELLSGQLKGTATLNWPEEGEAGKRKVTFSGVQKSTVNYWMNLPVPVFLFVADLTLRQLFFAPVKEQVRDRYDEYLKQKTFGFELAEYAETGTPFGRALFVVSYVKERFFPRFESALLTLLSHWTTYLDFIDDHLHLDSHMEAENHEELILAHIYATCEFLSQYFGIKWTAIDLNTLYHDDREVWKHNSYHLHYWSLEKVLPELRSALLAIVEKLKALVTDKQEIYWSTAHPLIHRSCLTLDTSPYHQRANL